MKQHKCIWCEDSGMADNNGQYLWDCSQPGCTAAEDRTALDEFVATLKAQHETVFDIYWAIHQRATELAEQKAATAMANQTLLVEMPRRRRKEDQIGGPS